MEVINFKKFKNELMNDSINQDEVSIRKIINSLSKTTLQNCFEDIFKLDIQLFYKALEEFNKPMNSMDLIKDMIVAEYVMSNIKTIPAMSYDEEIY